MNAEQIFVDALGREPTADELRDIRLMVWMLTRAGFAVEDPSNAPFIAPWAWIWARLPQPLDSHAALTAAGQTIAALFATRMFTTASACRRGVGCIDPPH